MTSPTSSSLLNEPVDTSAPRAPQHVRSVTHVVPQPVMAVPQPQLAYAPAAPQYGRSSTTVSTLVLGLLVVLVGAVALIGGYYVTKQFGPSSNEVAVTRGLAMRQGFQAGQSRGTAMGREAAASNAAATTALRSAAARQAAYDAAYRRGERAGRNSYHPRSYGYGGGYRGPRYSFPNSDLYSAFGTAQQLANTTGAPVDVELYG